MPRVKSESLQRLVEQHAAEMTRMAGDAELRQYRDKLRCELEQAVRHMIAEFEVGNLHDTLDPHIYGRYEHKCGNQVKIKCDNELKVVCPCGKEHDVTCGKEHSQECGCELPDDDEYPGLKIEISGLPPLEKTLREIRMLLVRIDIA